MNRYVLEGYKLNNATVRLFGSTSLEKTQAVFERIRKPKGAGYKILRYPDGEIIKWQEYRQDGLHEWNGKEWIRLTCE